ncbi:MAG: hypothetical protein HUK01_10605 [Bacteroidaceae bacterium]|nr:hypothetical protein [Bacteroidaceae bacterium]
MSKETYLMEALTRDLIQRNMEETGATMRQAMDKVYNSRTYMLLTNPATGLYFQSESYVYDILAEELDATQPATS